MNDYDYNQLSAYIDGELTDNERQSLELRLQEEPELRGELQALRQTVNLIQQLPAMKAPRNYMLTAEMLADVPERTTVATPRNIIPLPFMSALSSAAAAIFIIAGVILLMSGDDGNDLATTTSSDVMGSAEIASQFTETAQVAFTNLGELSTEERLTAAAGGDVDAIETTLNADVDGFIIEETATALADVSRAMPTTSPNALEDGAAVTGGLTADSADDDSEAGGGAGGEDTINGDFMPDEGVDSAPEAEALYMEEEVAEESMANDPADESDSVNPPQTILAATAVRTTRAPSAPLPTNLPPNLNQNTTAQDMMSESSTNSEPAPLNMPVPTDALTQSAVLGFNSADDSDDVVASVEEQDAGEDGVSRESAQEQPEAQTGIVDTENQAVIEAVGETDDTQNTLGLVLIVVGLIAGIIGIGSWWLPRRQQA